ncbi:F-box/WD-40 repeat-containing protein 1-like [Mercurialis annua]|uniref:F-box/WD-40 repeat-containing protein 1-like n=1 Tax=Mercurialis annua TaxID=3986 RepID=UPI00215FF3E9|nr:F-box/WD-40 repeat-containing protein 1-like [Mercurialis annua]
MATKQIQMYQSITAVKKPKGIDDDKEKELNFVDDLLHDILINLPVKSLVRFRSVSKTWKSLISDNRFITDHLRIHQSNTMKNLCLLSRKNLVYNWVLTIDELEKHKKRVCDRLLLWNPYTADCKTISLLDPNNTFPAEVWEAFGFGYDSSTDGYKVVRVPSWAFYRSFYRAVSRNRSVYVMSLKSNLWRKLDIEFSYFVSERAQAISTSGSLYWFALIPRMADN